MEVILVVLGLFLSIIIMDALLYGYYFEGRIQEFWMPYHSIFHNRVTMFLWDKFKNQIKWLFDMKGGNNPIRYRIFQKIYEISCLGLIFYLYGFIPVLGALGAFYFMTNEFVYYLVLDEVGLLWKYEIEQTDVYWLKHFYQSGYWFFRPFEESVFTMSAIMGFILLCLSISIYLVI